MIYGILYFREIILESSRNVIEKKNTLEMKHVVNPSHQMPRGKSFWNTHTNDPDWEYKWHANKNHVIKFNSIC